MNFWWTVLAAAVGQMATFILVEGFKQSYWGRNAREEITRIWDSFSKHMTKQKEKKVISILNNEEKKNV
jgi:hypothetical protein